MLKGYTTLGKAILAALAAFFVLAVVMGIYTAIRAKPKAEAKLRGNQVEAVQSSASDAVNTVGKAGDREAASNDLTRSNNEEIMDADGADEVVRPGVRDAGLDGLCRRASYQRDPKCVQRANPR